MPGLLSCRANLETLMASLISQTYLQSLAGGALIGLASALYLLLDGRVAGVSGILSGSLRASDENQSRNIAFVLGLVLGPVLYRLGFGAWPVVHIGANLRLLALAGLFVGFGTCLGCGCTSGHGVCGLARLSPRSIAAVVTFLIAGIITVASMNALGVP
jgi:uncharacterized membrane protein YedE/YeeE